MRTTDTREASCGRRASFMRAGAFVTIGILLLGPLIAVACGDSGAPTPAAALSDEGGASDPNDPDVGAARDATSSRDEAGIALEGGSADANQGAVAPSVVTNRYDNARSGANLEETQLTTANVNANHFGLLFSRKVDGQIYAQPLYLSNVKLHDGTLHNIVYVATAHNTVFAFDADDPALTAPLWQRNLGPAGPTTAGTIKCDNLSPEVGITATPVIDRAAGVLYVVDKTYDGQRWAQHLHALSVITGDDLQGSPQNITASVPGTAADAVGGIVSFNPTMELGRAGLLLQSGAVYMAFASHCDKAPYHGWILGYAYDGAKLTQTVAFNVSPNGNAGGIWQAGVGLSSDGTSVYAAVGNGSTNPSATPPDVSEGVARFGLADFSVQDYWIPSAYAPMNQADDDLSSGAILLPHDLIITGSKGGRVYLLDRANLGKYSQNGDKILQTLTTPGKVAGQKGHLHGGPVYYKVPGGPEWVYLWAEDSQLTGYELDPSARRLQTSASGGPSAQGKFATTTPGHPGGMLSLSANGDAPGTGILWASTPKDSGDGAWHNVDRGVFYAIDAADITHVLWSSDPMKLEDGTVANVAKFTAPVVVNGHVYVATFSSALNVYGLR